jgi:CRP-like cAMP-binding protein
MDIQDTYEALGRCIELHIPGLRSDQAMTLARIGRECSFESGDTVFAEGDMSMDLYLLIQGQVFLGATFASGAGAVVFASLGPADFFGWSALIPPHRKTAYAKVIQPAKVLIFSGTQVLALCDQDPGMGYVIMRRLMECVCGRLKATRQRMMDMLA